MPASAGDGDRQGADRRGLIDHHEQRPVLGELVEQGPQQRRFGVGQRDVMEPLGRRVQADRVMGIQAEEHPESRFPGWGSAISQQVSRLVPQRGGNVPIGVGRDHD
ncbi:hypothetical protein Acsp05_10220 [Actinokineospora sp. NBRC 105648]|nr:hypothetical protein Acsp05_10220 [Actinokineospora sp. NBRC 105648]